MSDKREVIRRVYARFNARDIDGVLVLLDGDVLWANGMEGGHVIGHEGVRSYWTRQWALIDPQVEPLSFAAGPNGETVVEVHQRVHDLAGNLLSERIVGNIFRIEAGLIRRFDIRKGLP
jgi:hypothetical protein